MWQLIILNFGMLLWLIYGIFLKDLPLILANAFSIVCYTLLIWLKLRYAKRDADASAQVLMR
jgi:MtN3 and saliva related transmembrane protein